MLCLFPLQEFAVRLRDVLLPKQFARLGEQQIPVLAVDAHGEKARVDLVQLAHELSYLALMLRRQEAWVPRSNVPRDVGALYQRPGQQSRVDQHGDRGVRADGGEIGLAQLLRGPGVDVDDRLGVPVREAQG